MLIVALPVIEDASTVYIPGLMLRGTCQSVWYSPLFVAEVGRLSIEVLLLLMVILTDAVMPASVPDIFTMSPLVYAPDNLSKLIVIACLDDFTINCTGAWLIPLVASSFHVPGVATGGMLKSNEEKWPVLSENVCTVFIN